MSIIEGIYNEYRDLEEEVYRLRQENEELRERCKELHEFFQEATKPNPDFYRSIIELVSMIPKQKGKP